jgi:hypothetical protein
MYSDFRNDVSDIVKYRYCNLLNLSYKMVDIVKIMLGETEFVHKNVTTGTFTSLKSGFT